MNRTFKIAIRVNGKEMVFTVTLLELQTLQTRFIDFRYIISGGV